MSYRHFSELLVVKLCLLAGIAVLSIGLLFADEATQLESQQPSIDIYDINEKIQQAQPSIGSDESVDGEHAFHKRFSLGLMAALLQSKRRHVDASHLWLHLSRIDDSPRVSELAFVNAAKENDYQLMAQSLDIWATRSPDNANIYKYKVAVEIHQGAIEKAVASWRALFGLASLGEENRTLIAQQKETALSQVMRSIATLRPMPIDKVNLFLQAIQLGGYFVGDSAHHLAIAASSFLISHQSYQLAYDWLLPYTVKFIDRDFSQLEKGDLVLLARSLGDTYVGMSADKAVAESGIEVLRSYLDFNPEDRYVQRRYGRLLIMLGKNDAAISHFQQMLALEDTTADATSNAGYMHYLLAGLRIEEGQYEAAKAHTAFLLKANLYVEQAAYYEGIIAERQERFEDAIRHFSSISQGGYWEQAQARIAYAYMDLNQSQQALEHLARVKQIPKQSEYLWITEARLYAEEGNYQQAYELLEKARIYLPPTANLIYRQASFRYHLSDEGRDELYVELLREVLELNPDHADALNSLGYHYAVKNTNLQEAWDMLVLADEITPNRYYILDSLGWAAFRLKNFDVAKKYLEQAFSMKQELEIFGHLYDLYQTTQDTEALQKLTEQHQTLTENYLKQKQAPNTTEKGE